MDTIAPFRALFYYFGPFFLVCLVLFVWVFFYLTFFFVLLFCFVFLFSWVLNDVVVRVELFSRIFFLARISEFGLSYRGGENALWKLPYLKIKT